MKLSILTSLILCANLFYAQHELKRYSCFADRIHIPAWLTRGARAFDSNGVVTNAEKYHPLHITQFAMGCYYEFEESGDSSYYHHFINQIEYFKSSDSYHHFDAGKSWALPYNTDYQDLKAPWYSGMTQGYTISVMFRYLELTNDKSIIPVIKKLLRFMLTTTQENGCFGKSPEGYYWIEEYPNSKESPQVLNGSINALIGLKEYCDYFPDDTIANKALDLTYDGLKKSIHLYDTGEEWSYYNRNFVDCSPLYLNYEIFQMKHLYEVFQDSIFLDQMKLYTFYLTNSGRNLEIGTNKLEAYKTSIKLKQEQEQEQRGGKLFLKVELPNYSFATFNYGLMESGQLNTVDYTNTGDSCTMLLNENKNINYIEISHEHELNLKKIKIELVLKDNSILAPSIKSFTTVDSITMIVFDQHYEVKEVSLYLPNKKETKVHNALCSNTKEFTIPFYTYHKITSKKYSKGTYEFDVKEHYNTEDYTVFFRGSTSEDFHLSRWDNHLNFKEFNHQLELPMDGFYEFLFIYKPTHPYSYISKPTIQKVD